jgi:hypothetical protein
MLRWLRRLASGGEVRPQGPGDSIPVTLHKAAVHAIVSVERQVMAVPEVDGSRMTAEWHGGPYLMKNVEREVSVIMCLCGEDGWAYRDEDVPTVFAVHLREVTFP